MSESAKSDPAAPGSEQAAYSLPIPPVKRWLPGHKAAIVQALGDGRLTLRCVESIYGVSWEEARRWVSLFNEHAEQGLRSTWSQVFSDATLRPTRYDRQPVRTIARRRSLQSEADGSHPDPGGAE